MPIPHLHAASADAQADIPGFACLRLNARSGDIHPTVSGELDIATAAQLDGALHAAQREAHGVTLDLRRLAFMDCRGMRVAMEAATRAREDGTGFLVLRGPPLVDRLFTLSGNDRRLDIVPPSAR